MSVRWPTDPVFRRFAALIADGVMYSAACGFGIGGGPSCRSPDGAALAMLDPYPSHQRSSHPTADEFLRYSEHRIKGHWCTIWHSLAAHFAEGFDGENEIKPHTELERAARRLGRVYRRRFVEAA